MRVQKIVRAQKGTCTLKRDTDGNPRLYPCRFGRTSVVFARNIVSTGQNALFSIIKNIVRNRYTRRQVETFLRHRSHALLSRTYINVALCRINTNRTRSRRTFHEIPRAAAAGSLSPKKSHVPPCPPDGVFHNGQVVRPCTPRMSYENTTYLSHRQHPRATRVENFFFWSQ